MSYIQNIIIVLVAVAIVVLVVFMARFYNNVNTPLDTGADIDNEMVADFIKIRESWVTDAYLNRFLSWFNPGMSTMLPLGACTS